ncbi:ABC transporter ATP-binding protein [Cellulomonas fimi]|uniref:ABC transporter ATP-binding protein n=1 Tax=Cellulomonas sp. RIT-PI-Y TaxID=3035297 RepID=UPI0021D9D3F4
MTETPVPYLRLSGVAKTYPGGGGVRATSVDLDEGEMLVLLGPSGCGKTTLLNMVAGLLEPDQGSVLIGGKDLTRVPTHQRNISMVFQTWALFPSMTVAQNVAFGLKMRRVPKAEQRVRVAEALRVVRLEHLADRRPAQLSGGQQQRVALARAIVTRPRVLLLDEPLSSLDHQIRVELRRELRRLQRELGLTGVYVTHDHAEALALGDRILVMRTGEVVEGGEPREVFARPRHRYTAEFLSVGTVLDAEAGSVPGSYRTALGVEVTPAEPAGEQPYGAFCLRPTSIRPVGEWEPGSPGRSRHTATVVSVEYEPAGISYGVQIEGAPVLYLFTSRTDTPTALGDRIVVECDWTEAIPLVAA